jgi:TPR repeat protein
MSAYPASAVKPDMKEARRWYERAAELENAEAQKRLSELPAR